MNFLWQTMASRLLEFKSLLGPNFERVLIVDQCQPGAKVWWEEACKQTCEALCIRSVDDFNQLKDTQMYDLVIWTLPPSQLLHKPLAQAVWTKLRMHTQGFMIFVTPGPLCIPALNQVLGTDLPNTVLDFHDIGDQLQETGWQRPMLQGQPLPIQYHKRQTVYEDWMGLGDVASHPLWQVKPIPNPGTMATPLSHNVTFDITVGLVYNGPDRTVQQQFDDGTIAIPLNQIKKRS